MSYFLVFAIGSIPLFILIYSLIDRQRGERERVNWKWAGITSAFVFIVFFGLSFYFKHKYGFPVFPNLFDVLILLIVAGVAFVLVGGISLFTYFSFRGKDVPKSVHDPKLLPVITISIPLFLIYIGLILMPIGHKISYTATMETAKEVTASHHENEEFTVTLTMSDTKCFGNSSSTCRSATYKNFFFVRNNMDKPQEVQVSIRAYGANQQPQREINSDIIKLEPGETKLITTEDSPTKTSQWNMYSFETAKKVNSFDYVYRYRDIQ